MTAYGARETGRGYLIPPQSQRRAILAAVGIDSAVFSLALVLGYYLLGSPAVGVLPFESSFEAYRRLFWLPLLAAPAGFWLAGLYRRDPYRLLVRSAEQAFLGVLATAGFVLAVTYVIRGHVSGVNAAGAEGLTTAAFHGAVWGLSLSAMLFTLAAAPLFVVAWRFLANRLESRLAGWSLRKQRLLIVGHLGEGDLARLAQNHSPCYEIVGCLEGSISRAGSKDLPCLGGLGMAGEVIERERIDEILVVSAKVLRDDKLALLDIAVRHGARLWFISDVYDTILSAAAPVLRGQLPMLEVRETYISGWTLVIKRLIDIVVSAVLLALSLPFILPACVAIVVESKGFPVFAQQRVGLGGRTFRLYKLRTMVIDADRRGPALTEDRDPRITRVGAFLRRTSIDELPQLWNVFRGDMSLIGPRAVVPFVADRFEEWERVSLNVKPGLTGLAQVSGRDEVGFREKSLLNIYYVRNYSLWLDLRIFFTTILVVLSMEGTGGTRRD